MEQRIHIPGQETRLGINLVEAAQEIQSILDNANSDPVLQSEMLNAAMDMFESATEICGGSKVYLHSHRAFIVNPTEFGPHSINIEPGILGEMWMLASFNGIVHFEEYLNQPLNSLCLDLTDVKVVNDIQNTAKNNHVMGTVVVPVKQIQSVLAA